MSSTYHIHADALDADFLASLKTLYKNRTLTITVEPELDETDRILPNPVMKATLDAALADYDAGKGVLFTPEQFEAYSEALLRGENPDVQNYGTVQNTAHRPQSLEQSLV